MNLAEAFAHNLRKVQELEDKELPIEILLKKEGEKIILSVVFTNKVFVCEALTACITVWCSEAASLHDYAVYIDKVYNSIELVATMPVNSDGLLETINFN